jgi:hypothetical protein
MSADLIIQAQKEQAIIHTPEADALQEAIYNALDAYFQYLDRNGLISSDDKPSKAKASGLVATRDLVGTYDVYLKDGPSHRLYGTGQDPWPLDQDLWPLPPESHH